MRKEKIDFINKMEISVIFVALLTSPFDEVLLKQHKCLNNGVHTFCAK